jgi:hypothetical protein
VGRLAGAPSPPLTIESCGWPGDGTCTRPPARDDDGDVAKSGEVLERVAVDDEQIGVVAVRDGARPDAESSGSLAGSDVDDLRRRDARVDVHLEMPGEVGEG